MHIVYLVTDFSNKGTVNGGSGNYTANIAQIMKEHGHQVSIVAEADQQEFFNWNGINVYYIHATRGFKNTGKQMSVLQKTLKNLQRSYLYNEQVGIINKKNKVDLVQSVNTYGVALFRRKNIPYLIRLSSYAPLWGAAEREDFDFEKAIITRRLDEELQILSMKKADKVISPSHIIANIVKERIGRDVTVVESPVLIKNSEGLRLNEARLEEKKYFVTFGANTNRKCIQMLASVIDTILDKYPDMQYVVIGRDKLIRYRGGYAKSSFVYDDSIKRNKSSFFFLGEISDRKRLFSIVKNACLCILPTRIDNLPNTVLEALALGKIIVSSTSENGTSVEQLIVDGENGYLAKVDNKEDLLQKIDVAMNLAEEDKELMEKRAQQRVEPLGSEIVYNKMIKIYEEVIED